jgi:hypothetical protein
MASSKARSALASRCAFSLTSRLALLSRLQCFKAGDEIFARLGNGLFFWLLTT